LIIVGGVLVFVTADKYDKNNFSLSSEITGIYLAVAGLLWGISLALYNFSTLSHKIYISDSGII
jgi:hypothetical protein